MAGNRCPNCKMDRLEAEALCEQLANVIRQRDEACRVGEEFRRHLEMEKSRSELRGQSLISVTKENERLSERERTLKDAVILARATLAALDFLCGKKVMKEIFGSDLKSVRLTQKKLDEAFALADPVGAKLESYHGCFTGDCPHETQAECDAEIARARAEDARQAHIAGPKPPEDCL